MPSLSHDATPLAQNSTFQTNRQLATFGSNSLLLFEERMTLWIAFIALMSSPAPFPLITLHVQLKVHVKWTHRPTTFFDFKAIASARMCMSASPRHLAATQKHEKGSQKHEKSIQKQEYLKARKTYLKAIITVKVQVTD